MVTTKHKLTVNIQNINHSTIHIIKRTREEERKKEQMGTKKQIPNGVGRIPTRDNIILNT